MPLAPFMEHLGMAWRALVGSFPATGSAPVRNMLGGILYSEPPTRTSEQFLQAYSTMPWLRATTHRRAEAVASIRWHVYAVKRRGRFQRMTDFRHEPLPLRKKYLREWKQAGELTEIENTPLLAFLMGGNGMLTSGAITRVTQIWLDILGEAFWLKERNRAGVPIARWPIPPTWIRETPTMDHRFFRIGHYAWEASIPDTEILWLRDPDPANPYGRGSGTAKTLADELEIDEASAKYVRMWFYNRSIPPIVIAPKQGDRPWADTQRKEMLRSWEAQHQGIWKAFKAQFSPIAIDIHQLTHTFQEQQLGELRKQERDTIIQVFGMSPESLGIMETANRATAETSDFLFKSNAVVPAMELHREIYQEFVVPEYDDRLIVEYDDPVPEDKEFKLNAAKAQPQALTQNEWREMLGLDPLSTGNVHYVPNTVHPVLALDEIPEPAVPDNDMDEEDETDEEEIPAAANQRRIETRTPRLLKQAEDEEAEEAAYLMIHRIAERMAPGLQAAFRRAVAAAKGNVDMQALADALQSRLATAAEDAIPWVQIVEALREASRETFLQTIAGAGSLASQQLRDEIGVSIGFNTANPMVAQFAQSQAALLVTRVDEASREGIRQAIARVFSEGRTAQHAAREIRDKIGLLPRQEAALEKFRAGLIARGRPEAEIVRRVERMSQALLRQRSLIIGVNEVLESAREGQLQLWRQAAERGSLDTDRARRFWVTSGKDNVHPGCEEIPFLNPNGVRINEPYITEAGPIMRPGLHVMCACTEVLRYIDL